MTQDRLEKKDALIGIAVGALVLTGLYYLSAYSYLLFHGAAEIFSVIIAGGIFMVAWNSRRLIENNYLLFIGVAYLFIGILDLLHALAYKGMGVFPGYGANLPTQLWIAGRYLEAASLATAPFSLFKRPKAKTILACFAALTTLLIASIFWLDVFPVCFIEGVGLTPFKKVSEYLISLILIFAGYMLYRRRSAFEKNVYFMLQFSIIATIVAELAFTFYISVYGISNLFGHFFKLLSFYLIYRAIIVTGLTRPYDLLFRELKQSEDDLKEALYDSNARRAETAALLKASRAVLEYTKFPDAARAIFDYCREITGASAGYVALLSPNEQENEVLFLESGGISCSVNPELPMPVRGLRETAYREKRVVYDNAFSDSKWMEFIPEGHVKLENVMFAPLLLDGKAVGLLGLANKPGGFDDSDEKMAAAFGDLAAVSLRKSRIMELLEDSEARFRAVAETANDAIITTDTENRIMFCNRGAEAVFGYSAEEMAGKDFSMLIHDPLCAIYREGLERSIQNGDISSMIIERPGTRKDGTSVPLEVTAASWSTSEGEFCTGIMRDITDRKRRQQELEESLREKEMLIKEIHHRVKNNFIVVYTLLRFQSRFIKDDASREIFRESQERVKSMSLLHEKFYRSENIENISFSEYIRALAEQLFRSYEVNPDRVRLVTDIAEASVDLEMMVPFGLMINELITNAIKHAFPNDREGEITLKLKPVNEGTLMLTIKDNGVGLPAGFDITSSESMGMDLISMFLDQVGGTLDLNTGEGQGTEFSIEFEKNRYKNKRR